MRILFRERVTYWCKFCFFSVFFPNQFHKISVRFITPSFWGMKLKMLQQNKVKHGKNEYKDMHKLYCLLWVWFIYFTDCSWMFYIQSLIVYNLNLDCCGAPDQRDALILGKLQLFVLLLNPFQVNVGYMCQRFSRIDQLKFVEDSL